jgi:hypothetical protein
MRVVLVGALQVAGALDASSRQAAARNVFRPSHILPTVSLAEHARMEMAEAQQRQAAQAEAEAGERTRVQASSLMPENMAAHGWNMPP